MYVPQFHMKCIKVILFNIKCRMSFIKDFLFTGKAGILNLDLRLTWGGEITKQRKTE